MNGKKNPGNLTKAEVCLFLPNLIDYLRIILLIAAWVIIDRNPVIFVMLYITSAILDGFDGYAARKLNQESELGVFLDVMTDIFGRGIIWCFVSKYGYFFPAFEWIVFIANTAISSSQNWKASFDNAPTFVKAVMANGFKTLLGGFVIAGLHALPIALYFCQHPILHFMPLSAMHSITFILGIGRLLCLLVEMWCFYNYLNYLVDKTITSAQQH